MTCPPILFLTFNRPDTTARVFEAIQAARPARLYVAADGPRPDRPGEAERCAEVRRIATAVNWPCEVKTLFGDRNLGSCRAVSGAITWLFEHEPEGIVLEDDTLPSATFFAYCAELLAQYRDNDEVMAICGGGYSSTAKEMRPSYFFSRYFDPWGWATWKRAWVHYDSEMSDWETHLWRSDPRFLSGVFPHRRSYWRARFEETLSGKNDSWDYRWAYSIMKNGGLAAFPKENMISNLGWDERATHTRVSGGALPAFAAMELADLQFPLTHPPKISVCEACETDVYAFRLRVTAYATLKSKAKSAICRILPSRIKQAVKALLRWLNNG